MLIFCAGGAEQSQPAFLCSELGDLHLDGSPDHPLPGMFVLPVIFDLVSFKSDLLLAGPWEQ